MSHFFPHFYYYGKTLGIQVQLAFDIVHIDFI